MIENLENYLAQESSFQKHILCHSSVQLDLTEALNSILSKSEELFLGPTTILLNIGVPSAEETTHVTS